MDTQKDTEVDAYLFIRSSLKNYGWNPKDPTRSPDGQVYTQNQCLSHPEIHKQLGQEKPENIVKISEKVFWVIEAKNKKNKIDGAIKDAKYYADKINKSNKIKALFISGVAGNENEKYIVKNFFFENGIFRPLTLNKKETSGLLYPELTKRILKENKADIEDIPVDEALFLRKAERINQILHLGAINKNYRARVMASLLLSMVEESPPNIENAPSLLISEINARARRILKSQGKADFFQYIELTLPPTEDNHLKFKRALVDTIQELDGLNIRSAMNSGTDVLGKFYEVFLKYGNGAKEIGIVLTPRHITQFAADVMNIGLQDIVYDLTCGTGGFLVSAFDYVKRYANQKQIDKFKQNNLFGIDQEPEVVALAIVNMIFRGDGKNNITEGNCFSRYLNSITKNGSLTAEVIQNDAEDRIPPVTKVLMNPPFALKSSDEKEYKFIDHALKQMQDGGILFSVLPYSLMVKPDEYLSWRKSVLENNTLLSVITFPEDLFYPIGVHTIGVFIKKGIPHLKKQNVFWIRALNDGFLKSKGKRLPNKKAHNDFEPIKSTLKSFIIDPSTTVENIKKFQKSCPIDFSDSFLELVPENYLDDDLPEVHEIQEGVEQIVRETVAYLIRTHKEENL